MMGAFGQDSIDSEYEPSGGFLWLWYWTIRFHITWVAEQLLASQEYFFLV
jgi:hypothetical protein